jgi:signal transduction histidine kinase/biopolymer transport protein ExbD
MPLTLRGLWKKFRKYRLELKHLLIIFTVLVFFLITVAFINKTSLQDLLVQTQQWYQKDSAERMANLTATSLELLLVTIGENTTANSEEEKRTIQGLDIVLTQQRLQQHVQNVCILVEKDDHILAIDDGRSLYNYFFNETGLVQPADDRYPEALQLYRDSLNRAMFDKEQIVSVADNDTRFHVFVPFVPKGEFVGAVYIENTPDFTFITEQIITSFDFNALVFVVLITLGLMAMFYISSNTLNQRDETQQMLLVEQEKYITEKLDRQKEELFTKRIYHTHHKAEKVMGFIKEDVRNLTEVNLEEFRPRLVRYANFVSRVIYDMKWYDPPLQTIRNPLFHTDLNKVLQFIVDDIFLRTSRSVDFDFNMKLSPQMPAVNINEFVIWEVFEPLLQNCLEHSGSAPVEVTVETIHEPGSGHAKVIISDNGHGFHPDLLKTNDKGIKKIFVENVSTKENRHGAGYGCYIAYQIATRRCDWQLDAHNNETGGARFTIIIPGIKTDTKEIDSV